MTRNDRDALRRSLMQAEGLRLKPYRDTVGKLTVGYGRNLDDQGLSPQEASLLLENDIADAERDCERAFAWFTQLDGIRQQVVVELVFNMGLPTVMTFKRTLAAIEAGDYAAAAAGLLNSKWAGQVKALRSNRIAEMLRTGQATA